MARRSLLGRLWRRLLLLSVLALVVWLTWETVTWPDVKALGTRAPVTTAFIERYKEREHQAGRQPRVAFRFTSYAAISPHLKRAVLVAEDINFFSHGGFDWGEIRSAFEEALDDKKEAARGASTITQQLAKNLWLSSSRNPLRKVKEAILTWQLERSLSKRRILELYLNVIELGPGIYGVVPPPRGISGSPRPMSTRTKPRCSRPALVRSGVECIRRHQPRVSPLRHVYPLAHGQGRVPLEADLENSWMGSGLTM